jgi:hypothetical protein
VVGGFRGGTMSTGEEARTALVKQWALLAAAVPGLDLDARTRLDGWTNRELLAHLAVQPLLLLRFLHGASPRAEVSLAANLAGTGAWAAEIDRAARDAASAGRLDLSAHVRRVLPALRRADLARTVVTLQGPISLSDYLVTRCVEAVVHGLDLAPPVPPDPGATTVAATALLRLLTGLAPDVAADASRLDPVLWLEAATGRRTLSGALGDVLPLMV